MLPLSLRPPPLQVHPAPGANTPRLWVRRVVVWDKPGGHVVREVVLRPGLNIIWSPDPAEAEAADAVSDALGHGGGKTLFCRLLRYCLGERRFAPEGQRAAIANAFKEGIVGAEVVVDGSTWSVVRALGSRGRHVAIESPDLNALACGDETSQGGVQPLIDAIQTQLMGPVAVGLMPTPSKDAWLTALAWLSRDQECRFDSTLEWRAASAMSESPARDTSTEQRLLAVRALLGALSDDETSARTDAALVTKRREAAESDVQYRAWDVLHRRRALIADLGLVDGEIVPGRLGVDALRKAVQVGLRSSARVGHEDVSDSDLIAMREDLQRRDAHDRAYALQLASIEGRIPEIEHIIADKKASEPGLSVEEMEAKHFGCPVCEVPIDRVLASGCNLSHKVPNLESVRKRRAQASEALRVAQERLIASTDEVVHIKEARTTLRPETEAIRERVAAIEAMRSRRDEAWRHRTRRLAAIDDLERAITDHEAAVATRETLAKQEVTQDTREAELRSRHDSVVFRLQDRFGGVIKALLGPTAEGRIALGKKALTCRVLLNGERSTAAIDSLKVLAFDVAVMILSMEGRTALPAWLVHDSPREADLSLLTYRKLFEFARGLEAHGDVPLFQYILTTTTRPPADLCSEPWLRCKLHGAPASERLLGHDL